MPKRISAADRTPLRVTIITLNRHLAGAAAGAQASLRRDLPSLTLTLHAAADWRDDPSALDAATTDIARADIVVVTMLFMEEHINPVLAALKARRDDCDALIAGMSAVEVVRLTRMGSFSMDGRQGGFVSLLKRLRGGRTHNADSGARQMAMLRRLPRLLRFIPGSAQDLRAYFLTLQYWLAGSEENIANMVRFLANRYANGPRAALRGAIAYDAPVDYPEIGLYHPRIRGRIATEKEKLPKPGPKRGPRRGAKHGSRQDRATVGLLVMRSYVLAGDTAHYDGVIEALEARGLRVVPAFAAGLDARPAIERFFFDGGKPAIDALVSLTGFSLVGGPAYNDASAAEDILARLDVPCLSGLPLEFQSLDRWREDDRGLLPIEATMMVAIPELDGAISPMVFGGRRAEPGGAATGSMAADPERVDALADRVARLSALRARPVAERKVGIVLFNFPPNAGSVGSAAHLSVFESLLNTLRALDRAGYTVDLPESEAALRGRILGGNAARHGTDANVCARLPVDDHVGRERWLAEIEAQWGPAPGRQLSDGRSLFVLGERFGNVMVGVQPAFGYEGDPMRLLFEKGFAPTHAFAAFYRYLREDFGADVLLHFGTHGALEFMPGKQVGLSGDCWPDRLLGNLPNVYLYAANNPSEGTIAKRRSAATLVSYLTPPLANAGLYRGLNDLKASVERWRSSPDAAERGPLAMAIQAQAAELDMGPAEPAWDPREIDTRITGLRDQLQELERALIPEGLHVVGSSPNPRERADLLQAMAETSSTSRPDRPGIEALVAGRSPEEVSTDGDARDESILTACRDLARANAHLEADHEIDGLLRALGGRYIRPVCGGDLVRTPEILPTGRNLHGFDPYRLPSRWAVEDGARQAASLLARHEAEGHRIPETVALVLWGSDNLKSEGAPIAQALALMGARPRFDGFGRLAGAELIPLDDLGRPRIDVVASLSGIFRDLLPIQTRMLAEAAWLAAGADEPEAQNFVRKHALAYRRETGCDLETAALRIFSNAEGAYGANVNHLIENGRWSDEDELAEVYARRKCYAYGRADAPTAQPELLKRVLAHADLAYQNLESVEVGVTAIDHYFDTLGGIGRAVRRETGKTLPIYIADQTRGADTVRTLSEQVALETRTRILNPKWYEGMLRHGYEGVSHIEAHLTNTFGWSATTGQVAPWVYHHISQTFVLDEAMRNRLSALNPTASANLANRLLEAHDRRYWTPDDATLAALQEAGDALEDRLEGVGIGAAA